MKCLNSFSVGIYMFKVNNRKSRARYEPCPSVSLINFEHVIAVWVIENDPISQHQSGFKPGDSRISQLLPINHKLYQSFDECFDVRSVFLDISKAFD